MKRVLILRMSSLGDVILASSALSALTQRSPEDHRPPQIDWLVHQDYADVLRGHPKIAELIEYDRNPRFWAWIRFSWALLRRRRYDHVYDLHGNIRSLTFRGLCAMRGIPSTGLSKSRTVTLGRYVLKGVWPKSWTPPARTRASAWAVGGQGDEKPDLRHLAARHAVATESVRGEVRAKWGESSYFCVMPSSRWSGKEWPAARYVEVLRSLRNAPGGTRAIPVILGRSSDPNSGALVEQMQRARLPFVDGVGRWSLGEVGAVLHGAEFYFGADTGLAHLAEAMGRPSRMLFMPGVPELGFGPWQAGSRAIGPSLWCRPCGKDGRYCHRIFKRHECMSRLEAADVVRELVAR